MALRTRIHGKQGTQRNTYLESVEGGNRRAENGKRRNADYGCLRLCVVGLGEGFPKGFLKVFDKVALGAR